MARFKKCNIRVNKSFVKREIIYKFGSINEYCKKSGFSRMRFWNILNTPHLTENVECLQKLAKDLDLSIKEILM